MAWKFRKRIKIAPGVNINLSKSGISTTVGPKGASINVGKNGIYLNTGIPGTGIYDRQRLAGGTTPKTEQTIQENNLIENSEIEHPQKEWSELTKLEKIGKIALAIAYPFLLVLTGIFWILANLGKIFKFFFGLFIAYLIYKLFFG